MSEIAKGVATNAALFILLCVYVWAASPNVGPWPHRIDGVYYLVFDDGGVWEWNP